MMARGARSVYGCHSSAFRSLLKAASSGHTYAQTLKVCILHSSVIVISLQSLWHIFLHVPWFVDLFDNDLALLLL